MQSLLEQRGSVPFSSPNVTCTRECAARNRLHHTTPCMSRAVGPSNSPATLRLPGTASIVNLGRWISSIVKPLHELPCHVR